MRLASRLAFALFLVAACGKKGGDEGAGSASATAAMTPGAGSAKADVPDDLVVPALAKGLQADNVPDGPLVAVTAKSIIVDGRAMVVVENGKVDPAELEGGAAGLRVPRVAAWAATWAELPAAAEAEAFLIAIDPALPSAVALQVITSLVPSKLRRFAFVVQTVDGRGTVPLELPAGPAAAPAPPAPDTPPDAMPVGMIVSLMPDRVVVWSFSRLEGTLAHPKLTLTPASDGAWLARLRDDLTDIRRRRWDHKARPDDQKTITLMVDGSVASGDLVNVIAAVRKDARGEALFPDVRLASGEEAAAMVAAATPPPKAEVRDDAKRQAAVLAALSEEEVTRFADLLTAEGSGSVEGDMSARRPGAELGDQIAAVRDQGAQVAIGGGGARGTRGDGEPRIGMGRGPQITGPGTDSLGDGSGAVKTPPGRIMVASKAAIEDTSLTVDDVLRKMMSAYMAGLKRCYKEGLRQDPSMRGAVSLSFTVNETGRVVSPKSAGMSAALDACFEGLMTNWRFNVPKDQDGEPVEAAFRIKLALTPE